MVLMWLCALVFLGLASVGAVPLCSSQAAPQLCCAKTQLLFLLDRSMTQSAVNNTEVIDFMKRARCFFEDGRTQTGLIRFNNYVETVIPLSNYTSDEWYNQLDTATATIEQISPYTPMAEAFWLAKKVFDTTSPFGPSCDRLNRLVVVLTDGYPVQNMPRRNNNFGTLGDPDVPRTSGWLSTKAPTGKLSKPFDYADYNEIKVPQQAKILKETTNSRILMVAMSGPEDVNGRVSYFSGEIDPKYACIDGTPTSSPTNTPSMPPTLGTMGNCPAGGNSSNTQCYRRRVHDPPYSVDGNTYSYGGAPITRYQDCVVRDQSLFPIATDTSHIVRVGEMESFFATALAGTGPLACPVDHCQA